MLGSNGTIAAWDRKARVAALGKPAACRRSTSRRPTPLHVRHDPGEHRELHSGIVDAERLHHDGHVPGRLEQRLAGLAAERRLAGLDRDYQALALPVEVLQLLPEAYLRSCRPRRKRRSAGGSPERALTGCRTTRVRSAPAQQSGSRAARGARLGRHDLR